MIIMTTLRGELINRGHGYCSIFGDRAEDIYFETVQDLCYALGYILKYVKSIDAEIPEDRNAILSSILPNYPICNGVTAGGNVKKWAPQYRIYFYTTVNMPHELYCRLQNDDKIRITGSLFVEACMYVGFDPGRYQDSVLIEQVVKNIFSAQSEQQAFDNGYNS